MSLLIHFLGYYPLTSLFYTVGLLKEYPMIYCLTTIYRCICLNESPAFTRSSTMLLKEIISPLSSTIFCLLFKDERLPYTEFLPKSKTILSPDNNSFSAPFISQKNFCCAKMLVAYIMLRTSNNINLFIRYLLIVNLHFG